MPPYGTTPSERVTMARTLAVLFATGAALVLVTIILPMADEAHDGWILGAVVAAFAAAAGLVRHAGRLSPTALWATVGLGSVLIAVCIAAGGESASAYSFMYVWVSLYAYAFFSVARANVLVLVCAALFAASLAVQGELEVPFAHWLMGVGSFGVAGLLIARLANAVRARAADAEAAARLGAHLGDAQEAIEGACRGLQQSSGADAVVFLTDKGDGLRADAVAGAREAAMALMPGDAREVLDRCAQTGEAQDLAAARPGGVLRGRTGGLVQPVLRDGRPVAVLALVWTTPRRTVPDRVRTAAVLFAAEVNAVLEREERARSELERQALELNDSIVQGLVVAKYSAQRGDTEAAVGALDETLERARLLISEQLRRVGGEGVLRPGDLARAEASSVNAPGLTDAPPA